MFRQAARLLRLLRQELGAEVFQAENTWYRDCNRRLSAVRDTAALTEALDKLQTRFAEQLADDAFVSLRDVPRSCLIRASRRRDVAGAGPGIAALSPRVEEWPPVTNDFSSVVDPKSLSAGAAKAYACP